MDIMAVLGARPADMGGKTDFTAIAVSLAAVSPRMCGIRGDRADAARALWLPALLGYQGASIYIRSCRPARCVARRPVW